MKENKRNIDEFFKSELGNRIQQPSPALWDALEKRLDDNSSKPPRVIWWLVILLLLVGAGVGTAAYYTITKNKTQTTAKQDPKTISQPIIEISKQGSEINSAIENEETKTITEIASNNKPSKSTSLKTVTELNKKEHNTKLRATKSRRNKLAVSGKPNERNTKSNSEAALEKKGKANILGAIATKNKATKNEYDLSDKPATNATSARNKNKLATSRNLNEKNSNAGNDNAASERTNKTNSLSASAEKNKTAKGNTLADDNDTKSSETSLAKATKKSTNTLSNEADIKAKNNTQKAESNRFAKEETIVFKPKKKAEKESSATVSENRGLSGVPDDMKEELGKEGAKNNDEDVFAPAANNKEIVNAKIQKQTEQVEKARAKNPLSGQPLAANTMEEIPSDNLNTANLENASGGGGGKSSSPKDKVKNGLDLAIGVKAGYEQGFAKYTAGKTIGSVFAEIRLSNKLGFILQPTIKFARTNKQFTRQTGSYIDTGAMSANLYNARVDSFGNPNGFYDFAYSQNYDSIVASSLTKNRFVEIEIPFLFRYKANKNFSVMAGMNFIFGKIIGTENSLKRNASGTLRDTVYNSFGITTPSPPSSFAYTGANFIASYKEPANPLAPNPVRFGYTVGLSYAIREKLMLDFIIQQNLSGGNNISDADIKKIFTQPYFRLSIGYSILGKAGK